MLRKGGAYRGARHARPFLEISGEHETVRAVDEGSFSSRLSLALKALSISRGRLAADLGVDKSAVARWIAGSVRPSEHNIARLTALIARHRPDFNILDWDLEPEAFAVALGVRKTPHPAAATPTADGAPTGLPLPLLPQIAALTKLRASAYEGFFRTTRPSALMPGRFLHDHGLVRLDPSGLLVYRMGIAGTEFHGWLLPIHNQLFCVSTEMTSGSMVFAIFNGVAQNLAEVIDGITLSTALDAGRTITAAPIILHRLGDLSGDDAADEARYQELINGNPVAPEGSIPEAIVQHLSRNFGPDHLATGDWMMTMAQVRSMARGPLMDGQDAP